MTNNMTRRIFLTGGTVALTFGSMATRASAEKTDRQIALEQYDRIQNLINTPHMIALQESALQTPHNFTIQDHEYFNALYSIRRGNVSNDIGGKGVLAYCVANNTRRAMEKLIPRAKNEEMRSVLKDIKNQATRIEDTLNVHLYDNQANPYNCSQVYKTYTFR